MSDMPAVDVLVDAAPDVGSVGLAEALAMRDPARIAAELGLGWVVVPVRREGHRTEVRLFRADDDPQRPGWELTLFSSVATLAAFLADDPERGFDFVRAASLTTFIENGRDVIARVVLDPAGPHPVAASVDDVVAALRAADAGGVEEVERTYREGDRVLDLDLPLGEDWFRIDLADEAGRTDRIGELVDRQLAGLDAGPMLRTQLLQWLRRMTSTAAGGGGREAAFLLRRTDDAALALSMTRYWQQLGAGLRTTAHLDAVAVRLQKRLGSDGELIGVTTTAAQMLRHTRLVSGSRELRAEDTRLLSIDYWLELPDGGGLCLVSFSTPHVDLRDAILRLTDEIVIESAWVVAGAAEAT